MTDGLFVYGTLRFPEVLRALIGRVPELVPAVAPGYRVKALPGVVYPGMVADPGAAAAGMLLTGLTETEWALLDAYEEDVYERLRLPLDEGRHGWAYVWRHETGPDDWDPDDFAARDLPSYLGECADWLRHYRSGTPAS